MASSPRANGGRSLYAQSLGVRVKAILLTYAPSTVALGKAAYRHDRKKTSRPSFGLTGFVTKSERS